jgi:DNA-binding NarL/FixJ family response regulator
LLAQANIYEQTIQDNSTIRTAISVLSALARQSIQQARDLGENLRPSILIDLGIEAALDTIANQLRRSHGTRVRLVTERKHERMPRKLEMALFRVAQDTCERAVQYAHANTIEIQYTYTVDHVQLSIGDDGAHQANLSMLDAAIQRIQQLGGSAQHARSPFGGLLLTIVLPLHSLAGLTDRELEVLRLLMVGQSNKQIANALQITLRTVNFHLDNIYSKLGVRSRTEAVIYALRYL